MSKTLKQEGIVLFSNLVTKPTFNGKPSDKYELTITLSPEEAADADNNGLAITTSEYQGQTQVKARLKTKYPLNSQTVVDRNRKPFTDTEGNVREIPRGSRVAVYYTTKPYEMMGKTGVTNYLNAVQVIEENAAIEFEDYGDEAPFDGEF